MFVDAIIEILHRVTPLVSIFNAMGDDPEIASFHAFSERLRREGYRKVVDILAGKKPLRPGLDGATPHPSCWCWSGPTFTDQC